MHARRYLLGIIALIASFAAAAETWTLDSIVPPGSTAGSNARASSVAVLYNDTQQLRAVAIGFPNATVQGQAGAGLVQIYTPNFDGSWTLAQTLQPVPWPQANAHFGASLAISGKHLVIGAPQFVIVQGPTAMPNGLVSLWRDVGANQPSFTQITGTGAGAWVSNFGRSVAIDGNHVVISRNSIVSVYRIVGDTLQLLAELQETSPDFGTAVAVRQIDASRYLIASSSPMMGQSLFDPEGGIVFLYANLAGGAPTFLKRIDPAFQGSKGYFGASLAFDSRYLAIGAPGRKSNGVRTGTSSFYRYNSNFEFTLVAERLPANAAEGDRCGESLAVDALKIGHFVVGCPGEDSPVAADAGAARSYRVSQLLGFPTKYGISETRHQWGAQTHHADALGTGVAITPDWVFAAAPYHNFGWAFDHGTVAAFLRLP